MKIKDITKYLPFGSMVNFTKKEMKRKGDLGETVNDYDLDSKEDRIASLKSLAHQGYALLSMMLFINYAIAPMGNQIGKKLFSGQPKISHSYNMKRTYFDINKNGLYDTLDTKVYVDGNLKYDKVASMGKECTAKEIEKITADRTPFEAIELK